MHARERLVAEIAAKQDNVITREQLLRAGLGRGAIAHRVSVGDLHRLHRGVYLLGHAPPTLLGRARAAVLACGEGAVLSHRSAAELWGVLPPAGGPVDVTVAGHNPGARPGIHVHRVAGLVGAEVRDRRGILVTAPARTVSDIAGSESRGVIDRVLAEARVKRIVTDRALLATIELAPTRRGSAALRAVLAQQTDAEFTRSEAERRLLGMIRAAKLPEPETNRQLCGYEVDFLWRVEHLVLEADGYAFHGHRSAFERDRRRDQVLVAAGYRVIRVTWHQLVDEPYAVIASIAFSLRADRA